MMESTGHVVEVIKLSKCLPLLEVKRITIYEIKKKNLLEKIHNLNNHMLEEENMTKTNMSLFGIES
jgi:hypothetical protein